MCIRDSANWERPIYMAITVGSENHLGMGNHFTQEGLAYRFTPFDTDKLDSKIDSEKMYDNLMNKFKFGEIALPIDLECEKVNVRDNRTGNHG